MVNPLTQVPEPERKKRKNVPLIYLNGPDRQWEEIYKNIYIILNNNIKYSYVICDPVLILMKL